MSTPMTIINPVQITTFCDTYYLDSRHTIQEPTRTYGYTITDASGRVLSFHYHCAGSDAEAVQKAVAVARRQLMTHPQLQGQRLDVIGPDGDPIPSLRPTHAIDCPLAEIIGLHVMLPSDNPDPDAPGNNSEQTHFGVVIAAVGSRLLIWRTDHQPGLVQLDYDDLYSDCGYQDTPEVVDSFYLPQAQAWLIDRGVAKETVRSPLRLVGTMLQHAERQRYPGSPAWRWKRQQGQQPLT